MHVLRACVFLFVAGRAISQAAWCAHPPGCTFRAPRVVGRGFPVGARDLACAPASLPDAFSADFRKKRIGRLGGRVARAGSGVCVCVLILLKGHDTPRQVCVVGWRRSSSSCLRSLVCCSSRVLHNSSDLFSYVPFWVQGLRPSPAGTALFRTRPPLTSG